MEARIKISGHHVPYSKAAMKKRTTVNLGLAGAVGFFFQRPDGKGLDTGRLLTAGLLAASMSYDYLPATLSVSPGNVGRDDPRLSGSVQSKRPPTPHVIHLADATHHSALVKSGPELTLYAPSGGAGRAVLPGGAGQSTPSEGSSSGSGDESSGSGNGDHRSGDSDQSAAGGSGEGPPPPRRVGPRRSERLALRPLKVYSEPKKRRAKPTGRGNGGSPPPPPPPPPPAAGEFWIDDGFQADADYLSLVPLDVLAALVTIFAGYKSLTAHRTLKRLPKRNIQKYLESLAAYNAMHDGELYHPCPLPELLSSICPNTDPALWPLAYYGHYMEQEYGNPYRIWVMPPTIPHPEYALQVSKLALARGTDTSNGMYALTFKVSMEHALADIADLDPSRHATHFTACERLSKILFCIYYALFTAVLTSVAWVVCPVCWDKEDFPVMELRTPRKRTPAPLECRSLPNRKWGAHLRAYADRATQVTPAPERFISDVVAMASIVAATPVMDGDAQISESEIVDKAVEEATEDGAVDEDVDEVFEEEVFEDASDEMALEEVAEELVDLDYQIIGDETVDYMLTQDEANAVEVFQNDAVETAIRAVFLDTSESDLDPNDIPNHMDDNSTNNSVFVYIPTEDPPQPVESEVEEEEEVAKFLYPAFVHSEVDDEEHGYDVFGEKKDVVVSDEEERLSNDKCSTLTVVNTVNDEKVTNLLSNTKDVMEKLDKGKQRMVEEDESQDYDVFHVDDTFANYRVPSNTPDPNESTNVLVEEKETVSPIENGESSTPTTEIIVDAFDDEIDEENIDALPVKREKVPGRRHRKRPNKKPKVAVITTEQVDPPIVKRDVLTVRNTNTTVETVVQKKTTKESKKHRETRMRDQRMAKRKKKDQNSA